jgi:hypothetical protein
MDLREFIEETIQGIVGATISLQANLEEKGVIINPPVSPEFKEFYQHGARSHTFRKITSVEFDIAVTAGSETGGSGKAGLKVFSIVEAGAEGKHMRSSEEVSRVRFSLPIVLSPAAVEQENVQASSSHRAAQRKSSQERRNGAASWMAK